MSGIAIRRATIALLLLAAAMPAAARHRTHVSERHHTSTRHHAAERHHASGRHRSAAKTRHETETADRRPNGTTAVPAGGIKLYCAGRTGPLLVRKMTQGQGTTVTVICR